MGSDAKEQPQGTSKGKGEVSSGSKPIEGVGTAVAALVAVGILILGVLRARNAYKDKGKGRGEVSSGNRPIEAVGTNTAA
jgi:hypothetical protein